MTLELRKPMKKKHEHTLLLICTTCDAQWNEPVRATGMLREYMASKPALRHNVEEKLLKAVFVEENETKD